MRTGGEGKMSRPVKRDTSALVGGIKQGEAESKRIKRRRGGRNGSQKTPGGGLAEGYTN